jgi:hypothetical protein
MAKVERFQKLKNVKARVHVGERWIEDLKVDVVDVFKDQRWRL